MVAVVAAEVAVQPVADALALQEEAVGVAPAAAQASVEAEEGPGLRAAEGEVVVVAQGQQTRG